MSVGGAGFGVLSELGEETAADRVVEVLGIDRLAVGEVFEGLQGLARSVHAGEGHAAVHGDDGAGFEKQELVV